MLSCNYPVNRKTEQITNALLHLLMERRIKPAQYFVSISLTLPAPSKAKVIALLRFVFILQLPKKGFLAGYRLEPSHH
jgi:hypothetical protein